MPKKVQNTYKRYLPKYSIIEENPLSSNQIKTSKVIGNAGKINSEKYEKLRKSKKKIPFF